MSFVGAQTVGAHMRFLRKGTEDQDGIPLPSRVAWQKLNESKKGKEHGEDGECSVDEVQNEMRNLERQFQQNFRKGATHDQRK